MTYTAGAKADGATALGVLTGEIRAGDAIQKTESGGIIPASKAPVSYTHLDVYKRQPRKLHRLPGLSFLPASTAI